MANSTPINTTSLPDERTEFFKQAWLISQICTSIMILACVSSIAAFYKYGRRKGRWKTSNKQQFAMMLMTILAPTMTLLRLIGTQIVIIIGLTGEINQAGDEACQASVDCCLVLYNLTLWPTYLYFWMRQRILYEQPLLSHLNTKFVKVLAYAVILLMASASLSLLILFTAHDNHKMSDIGCVNDLSIHYDKIPLYAAGAMMVMSQVWIFCLLIYPLRRMETQITGPSGKLSKQFRRANILATISMAICTFSDTFTLILVSSVVPISMPRCFPLTVYDFGLMVNIFSLMLSLEDFRKTVL